MLLRLRLNEIFVEIHTCTITCTGPNPRYISRCFSTKCFLAVHFLSISHFTEKAVFGVQHRSRIAYENVRWGSRMILMAVVWLQSHGTHQPTTTSFGCVATWYRNVLERQNHFFKAKTWILDLCTDLTQLKQILTTY